MAEQRPFKPFVEGSIPSALTQNPLCGDFLLCVPTEGMIFDPSPRSQENPPCEDFLLCVPTGGMVFEPFRAR